MAAAPDPFRGSARLIRGAALGGACLLVTAAGHAAGGGSAGGLIGLALLAPLALALGASWADRRRSVPALATFLLGTQVLLHMLLVVTSGHAGHHSALLPAGTMLAGHALASAGVVAVLAWGDTILLSWIVFLSSLARGVGSLPPIACIGTTADHETRSSTVAPQRSADAHRRRGPPAA